MNHPAPTNRDGQDVADAVTCHAAFALKRSRRIDTLNLTMHEFEHRDTGAVHFHLASNYQENVFMVALRTVPTDSSGVAHILEHTVLCGSERFPVRDPFFLMIRRSLNTFMNAFTASDYTAFPFASQNRKDFDNLLDIYLDAVFFPRLDPLDFAQEGHRLEFEKPDDPASNLVYRGVVYNEMKGDSSAPVSVLYDTLKAHLFPTTTYHYNSGGDPQVIPQLTYAGLMDFYRRHYHPSNAIFMTFGDIPAVELQAQLHDKVLHRFSRAAETIDVPAEQRYTQTQRVTASYAVDETTELENKTHIVMGWLLGPTIDLALLLKCNLLSDVLLDTSASPLRQALEASVLGGNASPLCGLEESNREMSFICGLEGSNAEHQDAVEALILETLQRVARDGVPIEKLKACLHQLELNQREIGGDGYPYGLQLIFSSMSAAIHRGDPIALLDLDGVLQQLHEDIEDPAFIKELVQTLLLNNSHRVRLTLVPDAGLNQQLRDAETAHLAAIKQTLTAAEVAGIVAQASALKARQDQKEPLEVLPKVGLADIADDIKVSQGTLRQVGAGLPLSCYAAGTNGLSYHQVVLELPELPAHLVRLLPIYTNLLTEVGAGGRDYLQTQHLQHALTGGVSAYISVRGAVHNPDILLAHLTLSSRTLNPQNDGMISLLCETFTAPNFTEKARMREIVKHMRVRREGGITGSGHTLAMTAAASHVRPVSRLNHALSGLAGIEQLKLLDNSLDDSVGLDQLVADLQQLHGLLQLGNPRLLLVSDAAELEVSNKLVDRIWADRTLNPGVAGFQCDFDIAPPSQAWVTTSQVNFCASAFATVAESHIDAPALSVLAGVLRNGYLHKVLREQGGAYGGGAGHDSGNGIFRFYSYRDPNLMATFDAFQASVVWLENTNIGFELVEESILGIISSLDAPGSPAGEPRQAFHNELFGRHAAHRRKVRRDILGVGLEDVKRVARQYLQGPGARAVVCHENSARTLDADFIVRSI
ncbi:MAG: insulinase family protein [Pseudomonadales bacterium]|jgi:presequence protease|nr:insulinase family protein [Pseudomonadales bacterium]MDP4639526.1 insulinase family protein [Pseudomonadales bacterium]MDP4764899.1 insulinase family protein [Pseudomonadales bacterium]MDP4876315.1 insulinase family protein [Pseudomonadales bacterium]MDP4912142.1 insulinase family protein [Pseudomonadales bacterium]